MTIKNLKMMALAAVAGIGLAGAASNSALADYTQCDRDGDHCWRVHTGYYDRDDYYRGYRPYDSGYYGYNYNRRWVCDEDGDNCHWAYGYYSRPHVGFSFGF